MNTSHAPSSTSQMLSRRALLRTSAAVSAMSAVGLGLGGCVRFDFDKAVAGLKAGSVMGEPFAQLPFVDVHCHIFNLCDIPAKEFATTVFLEDSVLANVLKPLLYLVEFFLVAITPTTEDELRRLASNTPPVGGGAPQDPGTRALADFLIDIDGKYGRGRTIGDSSDPFPRTLKEIADLRGDPRLAGDKHEFQRFLTLVVPVNRNGEVVVRPAQAGALPRGGASPAAPGGAMTYQTDALSIAGTIADSAPLGGAGPKDCVTDAGTIVRNAVAWALMFTKYRLELLQKLAELMPFEDERGRVFTPSLVDYDYWLKPEAKLPDGDQPPAIMKQVRTMEAIAKVAPDDIIVNCFVPFDPLRYAWERHKGVVKWHSMQVVQDAILKHGAIGAKIYPPMGYGPIGNTAYKNPNADFGGRVPTEVLEALGPRVGALIDESLAELYAFCALVDAPVFTHCSNSQGSFKGAALRAGPEDWEKVLEGDLRNLRVNLAHAGGPWCLATPDAKNCVDPFTGKKLGWFEKTIGLIATRKYPNLYLDIADFDLYMACQAEQSVAAVLAAFKDLLGGLAAAERRFVMDRMMYGTDWILLGRMPYASYYFRRMKAELIEPLAAHFKDIDFASRFFRENPLRFLGLLPSDGEPSPKTRARLNTFYEETCGRPGMLASLKL